ncbi:potassium channel family protein [Humibacter ginsenosidimutans]|uniref:Potassium channel family protein n=1 Tax=Humibacter ginsenosidimutans TaxID=2599293 RepID=A0A5B8MA42_9MICO|nr:potassium channel family protein [Humibacter ginsenosidimutans]QDZ16505.1 potassium channel family protein [Humibacter ginsenosidimutans]
MTGAAQRRAKGERAEQRWERLSAWPFLVLSAVFIVAYSIHCLDSSLTPSQHGTIWIILAVIWAIFVVDYVGRLVLAPDRSSFVRHNIPDLLAALVPMFRPFRALRELRRIEYFQGKTGAAVRARVIAYSVSFVALWVYTISITVVFVERGAPGATIVSLGDALYWSAVTMATVGYGDMVPVTTAGRVLAVMLMISGVGIVGVTTATIVSYLNDTVRRHVTSRDADGTAGDDRGGAVQVAEAIDEIGLDGPSDRKPSRAEMNETNHDDETNEEGVDR